ncbi:hypothetical protein [Pseudomonas sp. LB3P38]|uniref:hypothetical protein n=1 Tax=Pseudomonas lyxosi TaxID=3398358 RepID=UPI0039EF96BD
MGFPVVTEQDQNKVRYLVRESEQVLKTARILGERFAQLFSGAHAKEYWGLSFVQEGAGKTASLTSPFGRARASTTVHVGKEGVFGRYLIEKAVKNSDGAESWRAVWHVRISNDGVVYPGDEGGEPVEIRDSYPGSSDNDVARLGLSMLYSIGAN